MIGRYILTENGNKCQRRFTSKLKAKAYLDRMEKGIREVGIFHGRRAFELQHGALLNPCETVFLGIYDNEKGKWL